MNFLEGNGFFIFVGVLMYIRQFFDRYDLKGIEIEYGWLDQMNFEVLFKFEIFDFTIYIEFFLIVL